MIIKVEKMQNTTKVIKNQKYVNLMVLLDEKKTLEPWMCKLSFMPIQLVNAEVFNYEK